MNIKLFYHSLISCWNHGNAHFLRGIVTALKDRGHRVQVYEPSDAWSYENLLKEPQGAEVVRDFSSFFPDLMTIRYNPKKADYKEMVKGADLGNGT